MFVPPVPVPVPQGACVGVATALGDGEGEGWLGRAGCIVPPIPAPALAAQHKPQSQGITTVPLLGACWGNKWNLRQHSSVSMFRDEAVYAPVHARLVVRLFSK